MVIANDQRYWWCFCALPQTLISLRCFTVYQQGNKVRAARKTIKTWFQTLAAVLMSRPRRRIGAS